MDALQKRLQKIVKQMRADKIDLADTPAHFKWSYPEDPWVEYELLICETDQANLGIDDPILDYVH